ncbi:XdhC family protein [Chengkuizengella sediminis]|uniref:XdhC family protein n=1 Tax=Chengkuizengella sediminis TaxID=1885917 RepID=UPI00138A0806|nr:XdhC/CoxI family protein [Chengkuizengella sediminis]NDI37098.1 XdhC family protein [Chengkuizengella sediminis]
MGNENVHQILDVIQHSTKNNVLATILHVEGTAYLKEGTMMLIQEDGFQVGMLSAGCLENDLAIRSKEVFINGRPITITYDMSEETDISWGQGAGCNGVIYILLEFLDQELKENMLNLKEVLDQGIPILHIKTLTEDFKLENNYYYSFEGDTLITSDVDLTLEIRSYLHHNQAESNPSQKSGVHKSDHFPIPFYTHIFSPKPRLIIFGAGPDVKPLVSLAALTGFSITLCDWRTEFCNKEQFPLANEFIIGFPKEMTNKLNLNSQDYVVIMTHHFQRDQEILSTLIHQHLRYLGILGPRIRTEKLLNHKSIPPSLRSPIGLFIGAKGPQEIAISIVAELIQCLRSPFPQNKFELGNS